MNYKISLFFASLVLALGLWCPPSAKAVNLHVGTGRALLAGNSGCSFCLAGAAVDLNFATGQYWAGGSTVPTTQLSITRASQGTNLLPTSASGFSYATFANNTLRITSGLGLLIEEARTNLLLNSTAPATQTTGTLANGTYTLWINGSGTATMSAGTATGCGTSAASQGTPIQFTTSGTAGTCTVTVSGSLNAFQLELGSFGTSLCVSGGTTCTRQADNVLFAAQSLSSLQLPNMTELVISGTTNFISPHLFPSVIASGDSLGHHTLGPQTNTSISSYDGSNNPTATLGSGTFAGIVKEAAALSGTAISIVANNGIVISGTYSASRNINWNLGSNSSNQYYDGYISRIVLYNSALSGSALSGITQ